MSETEKITINVGPVDLGRIDVLVDQGLYSKRTDVIRTAIRNLLDRHEQVIENVATRRSFSLGALVISRNDLLKLRGEGKRISYRIIGALSLSNDIDPQLALDTIDSITVRGALRIPQEVREAMGDRIKR